MLLEAAADTARLVFRIGDTIIKRIWPDPADQAKAQLAVLQLQQEGAFKEIDSELQIALAQAKVNEEEAKGDIFRGGWRPFIGWTCGASFAYNYVVGPLLGGFEIITYSPLDTTELMPVLFGMLGLGAYRTYERVQGKIK